MVTLEAIKEFLALAEAQSFSRAAKELNISQPLLTKHILKLEAEFGFSLFHRTTRDVVLNRFGQLFLSYAENIVNTHKNFLIAADVLSNPQNVSLSIGILHSMMQYGINDIISHFAQEYHITPKITEASSSDIISMVYQNKCAIGFIRESDQLSMNVFRQHYVAKDVLSAILPQNHPLAGETSVSVDQLLHEDIIMLPETSLTVKQFRNACEKQGLVPYISSTLTRSETVVEAVAEGLGISFLMNRTAEYWSKGRIAIVPIKPLYTNNIYMIQNKNRKESSVESEFISYILRNLKER